MVRRWGLGNRAITRALGLALHIHVAAFFVLGLWSPV